jgi:primosomal protein N' (replication factor Y)
MKLYAEVYLPKLKTPFQKPAFTYEIPDFLANEIQVGTLVKVPFGRKIAIAIVRKISKQKPDFTTKEIAAIITPQINLSEKTLTLIDTISDYYYLTPHIVSNLFLSKKILNEKPEPKLEKGTEKICDTSFIKNLKIKPQKLHELKNEQAIALTNLNSNWQDPANQQPQLLIGPTGSGKTEIYLHLLKQLNPDEQALVLVPEIALTPQLASYFLAHFPDQIAIWHSELNDTEKNNTWWQAKLAQKQIFIGSRSSLFLPFKNLHLIIIDEEHAQSFKQDQTPRYHARTIAQFIQKQNQIKLLMGSATPSLETYFAAKTNRIGLQRLSKKINNETKPEIKIIDLKAETRIGNFSPLSEELKTEIAHTISQKKQVILFLNRRGYASQLRCFDCGQGFTCNNCDINLTVHRFGAKQNKGHLMCHLCGQKYELKATCPSCQSPKLKELGVGTEQVLAELEKLFPEARLLRADTDTTKKKHSFEQIYNQFLNHEADILIGTQMISKGLHFPQVDLIGVIMADIGLAIPDFRANELNFQLLTQVCGRAGRSQGSQAKILIQTLNPENQVLKEVISQDLDQFYDQELAVRQAHNFPPYTKICKITLVEPTAEKVRNEASRITKILSNLNVRFLASEALIFKKIQNYHYNILLFHNSPQTILTHLNLKPGTKIDRDPSETT